LFIAEASVPDHTAETAEPVKARVDLVPFEGWHLDRLCLDSFGRAVVERSDVEAFKRGYEGGHALTALRDGTPLGIGWATLLPGRKAEVGVLLSDELKAEPMIFHRICRRVLETIISGWNLSAVVARVPHGFEASHRWVRRFGFRHVSDDPAGYSLYERAV